MRPSVKISGSPFLQENRVGADLTESLKSMYSRIAMSSFVRRVAVIFLPAALMLCAPQSRAEVWCGDGPGTELSHPCTDADESPAVNAAVAKYEERWMKLDGVYSVEAGEDYHDRIPNIEVHVETDSVASAKEKIPSSVDGIPVVIVPGKMPEAIGEIEFWSNDRAENARLARQIEEREKARAKYEPAYTQVVEYDGESWMDLPGVIGIGAKCDNDGACDFSIAVVRVQRELLPEDEREIPSSVYGVKIVLSPED